MPAKPLKVLHVEDDYADAVLMQEILLSDVYSGEFDVVHVDSLKSALEQLQKTGFDAVLLDLNLPDICGIDNVHAIREQSPEMPVVILSGVDSDTAALQAIEFGAQDYIVKGHCDGKVIRLAIRSSIRRKFIERQLFQQANYDEITGLPNRRLFQDYLDRAINKAKRWNRRETLMFVDLDNFKTINDQYGHEIGNQVLKEVAIRMSSVLRESDVVARYGGDEFVILLDDRSEDFHSSAGRSATRLLYMFNEAFEVDNHAIECSASIGIAMYPAAGEDVITLIKSADAAMYEAKHAGGRQFRFAAMGSGTKLAI